jgi:predicted ATPase/DNA-binding winged helix-turn-helix (wHTH) protein
LVTGRSCEEFRKSPKFCELEGRAIAVSYAFGPFCLDAQGEILLRGTERVALSHRAVALLHILVDRAGAPVSKGELMQAAWPGLAVEESNLTVQIAALRRVLREEPGGESWIETVPRRGYRFVGPAIAIKNKSGPDIKAADDTRNNLPVRLTSFIGRTAVLGEIKGLLASNRLVTLAGVGGSGKTRLAIQAATEVLERFADGAWLVEFASLSDPAFVPHGAISALGISEQRGRPLMETLLDYMRSKSLLLIFDNCEHLLSACSEMADLFLHSCPSVRVLTTSREPLGIAGEVIFRVPPLSLPDAESASSAESLMEHEASRLFIERACYVQPGFRSTSANASEIAQICARLDGLPLAIELAAAQVRVLSVSQICARLNDQYHLLTSHNRGVVARHQTLGAMIDWSYELLSQPERTLLRRLSVFAGGWTLEAAEIVGSFGGVEKDCVFGLMAQLVDKSLVLAQTQGREARYSILEPVRQYALAKLTHANQVKQVRDCHLECFLNLTERVQPLLRGSEVVIWRDRLEAENDNIRAALQWSLEDGVIENGLRLAGALEEYWRMRGSLTEGRHWLDTVLAKASVEPRAARARALFGAGRLAWGQGALMRATEQTEAALQIFRELGDQWGVTRSLAEIGLHSWARGEYGRATLLADESLSIARGLGDQYAIGYALILQGLLAERAGDDTLAVRLFNECLMVRRRVGHKFGIANALRSLANVALRHNCYADAEQLYKESLSTAWEAKEFFVLAPSLEGLSAIALGMRSPERSARLLGIAEELRRTMGAPGWSREFGENIIRELSAMLDPEVFETLRAEGRAMTLKQVVPYCFDNRWPPAVIE